MLRDIKDSNLMIVIMPRGTDSYIQYQPDDLEDGTAFVWSQYTVTCEGRYAIANESPDFTFPVSLVEVDQDFYIQVDFPSSVVTSGVRESKLYWRVLATNNATGRTIQIGYGEVWLR